VLIKKKNIFDLLPDGDRGNYAIFHRAVAHSSTTRISFMVRPHSSPQPDKCKHLQEQRNHYLPQEVPASPISLDGNKFMTILTANITVIGRNNINIKTKLS